mmetsp:Transcript_7971/g.17978  ORF Transcript_7971/g.17978 Transcript_7971/m.17978 type:complete len:414 (+) Transcript_7971:182-1423(+)|eukprot:CAMPEP_0172315382 /NCGR_PEP_ID=MMETSP1058-20130122/25009_1 /TAXON_ID=83371 /ORGANISM="Detonula confervacea, Strain CCMP 353" /LENGTH=413 /DNA_ID=CAMNT_0013029453 /DNA_START=97 /DNA_END=1338 /DNA_ORIENTATION=-
MANEVECLHKFGQHCRSFYDSSLILRPSSSSLSSIQEEKKSDENPIGVNDKKKKAADGKVVLETLDRLSAIHAAAVSTRQQQNINNALQNSIASLRQEHTLVVERHHDVLEECGLLDIDRFLESSSPNDDHDSQNEDVASHLLKKYTQIRDAMRRRAHKISMLHRQNSLFELLSEYSSMPSKPCMTQLKNAQHNISNIQKFVDKYQSNIGSHPFLAGLYRIVDMQLNPSTSSKRSCKDPSYIVRWKFRGSVLTEACRSCHSKESENVDDELAYAREAIQVLFSFLIWIKDIDVEGGGLVIPIEENDLGLDQILHSSNQSNNSTHKEQPEPFLLLEIDKYISNANLRRILAVLPDPKRLDARATGSVEVLDASLSDPETANGVDDSNLVLRKNVDGHEDEQWPWFARLEFCTLL